MMVMMGDDGAGDGAGGGDGSSDGSSEGVIDSILFFDQSLFLILHLKSFPFITGD